MSGIKANGAAPVSFDELSASLAKDRPEDYQLQLEGIRLQLKDMEERYKWRLNPEGSFQQRWDGLILLALLWTATVTPYEIALLDPELWSPMFIINRVLDFTFLFDLVFSFFTMYLDHDGRLVYEWWAISHRYLCGMFLVDFISIIPFDIVATVSRMPDKTARVIRILRLLKLLRMARVFKIFKRWQTHWGVLYRNMLTLTLSLMLLALNHWLACFWGMLPFLQPQGSYTWFSAWLVTRDFLEDRPEYCGESSPITNAAFRGAGDGEVDEGPCFHHTEIYVPSLHWAMMTVTSIGYGDIVPMTIPEYAACVVFMLIAGVQWAVIIGGICSVVTAGDEVEKEFNNANDNMNRFMKPLELHASTKTVIRKFMLHAKSAMRERSNRSIMSDLSPLLAGRVSGSIPFIRRSMCAWLIKASSGFCAKLVIKMTTTTWPPQEQIFPEDCMYVLSRGSICTQNVVPMKWISKFSKSTVWNDNFLISQEWLKGDATCRTLAFCEVDSLANSDCLQLMHEFPVDAVAVRKTYRWIALVRYAQHLCQHQHKVETILSGFGDRDGNKLETFSGWKDGRLAAAIQTAGGVPNLHQQLREHHAGRTAVTAAFAEIPGVAGPFGPVVKRDEARSKLASTGSDSTPVLGKTFALTNEQAALLDPQTAALVVQVANMGLANAQYAASSSTEFKAKQLA